MTLVYIAKNWAWPDLMRQTPDESGIWNDIKFTLDLVPECDYVVVLNYVRETVSLRCPPGNVWSIIQEPPDKQHKHMHKGISGACRVYTQDTSLNGSRYIHSHPALPWHVNKTYSYLVNCNVPQKTRQLSWITSNKAISKGHDKRLRFLNQLQQKVEFDLYGRGFNFIVDKWDGLAPYRYSIAVENFQNEYYWSEKLADCYLAWTMPIYYGCTQIDKYFPPESMVRIDIDDPLATEKIKEVIFSNLWQERIDAIAEARNRVLNRYQLFPFITRDIKTQINLNKGLKLDTKPITLTNTTPWIDVIVNLSTNLRHIKIKDFFFTKRDDDAKNTQIF